MTAANVSRVPSEVFTVGGRAVANVRIEGKCEGDLFCGVYFCMRLDR